MTDDTVARRAPTRSSGIGPVLMLLVLPGFVAEALSGATPAAEYFLQPGRIIGYSLFYGSGAILARELALRWRRGWPSILILGIAFGIIEEGLGTKAFFDPNRTDLGPLVNYGTVGGVHWPFVVQLMIYHAVYSISVPIVLVELMFASRRHQRWVGTRGMVLATFGLVFFTIVLTLVFPYPAPPGPYVAAALAVVVLGALARAAPVLPGRAGRARAPGAFSFWLVGFVATVLFFLVSWGGAGMGMPPLLTVAGMLIVAVGSSLWVISRSGAGQVWSAIHQWALATGLLSPLILATFFQESRGRTGSVIVGLGTALFLFWLRRRLRPVPVTAYDSTRAEYLAR